VSRLPQELPAAMAVALYVPEESPSILPRILTRGGRLKATHAVDGEPLVHGRIYVAPPGHPLLVKRENMRVVKGPNENGHAPAEAGTRDLRPPPGMTTAPRSDLLVDDPAQRLLIDVSATDHHGDSLSG
jgi:hypothetical protein